MAFDDDVNDDSWDDSDTSDSAADDDTGEDDNGATGDGNGDVTPPASAAPARRGPSTGRPGKPAKSQRPAGSPSPRQTPSAAAGNRSKGPIGRPSDFKRHSPTFAGRQNSTAGGRSGSQRPGGSRQAAENSKSNLAGKARNAMRRPSNGKKSQAQQSGGRRAAEKVARGAGKGVARGLNSVGLPVSERVATAAVKAIPVLFAVLLVLPLLIFSASPVVMDSHDDQFEFNGMRPDSTGNLVERTGVDVMDAATGAAAMYSNTEYGDIPWSVLVSLAAFTTEFGQVSPFDSCVRDRGLDALRVVTPGGAAVADCAPDLPIRDPDSGVAGPLLLYPSAIPEGDSFNVDTLDRGRGIANEPSTSFELVAFELDRIRRHMVDVDGWQAPVGQQAHDASAATSFWLEAVSRLPVLDPQFATCATPMILADGSGRADNIEAAKEAIGATWRCELFRAEVLHHMTWMTDDAQFSVESSRTAAVATLVAEATAVAGVFSEFGSSEMTDPALCGRDPVERQVGVLTSQERTEPSEGDTSAGETTSEADDTTDESVDVESGVQMAEPETPVGVFPLTQAVFDAHNPIPGASRCDLGANVHAAVRAFIAGEAPERDVSPEGAIGGWAAMPWALGDSAHVAAFLADGPHVAVEQTEACREDLSVWLQTVAARTDLSVLSEDGSVVMPPLETMSDAERLLSMSTSGLMDDMRCDDARYGEDLRWLGREARTLQSILREGSAVGERDTGQIPDIVDVAEERVESVADGNLLLVRIATSLVADQVDDGPSEQVRPGVDAIMVRLSSSGRIPPATVREGADVALAQRAVSFAVSLGGLLPGDSRVNMNPFDTIGTHMTGMSVFSSLTGGIVGVPDVLMRAVQHAVVNQPAHCGADVAFLLATAFEESGAWWDQIDSETGLMDVVVSSKDARGPFQFIETTWKQWGVDADGDGDRNVDSVFDSAAASINYQCWLVDNAGFSGGWVTDENAIFEIAVDYHGGHNHDGTPDRRETAQRCREQVMAGVPVDGCANETYAKKRMETTRRYREAGSVSVEAGTRLAGAIAFALNQQGKAYCNSDDSCRYGPETFDCSGLIVAAYRSVGHDIAALYGATWSGAQLASFERTSDLQPGDLLFYDWPGPKHPRPVDHVAIYLGGGEVIEAVNSGVVRRAAKLDPAQGFIGSRRVPGALEPAGSR